MSEHARVLELIQLVSGDPSWLADHRAEVVAAVLSCDRDGSRELGTRLATAVWPHAGHLDDPGWWSDLGEAGESLARADRDSATLVDLLDRCARTFALHGDRLRAEERWVRALAVARRDGLHPQCQAVLSALADLYRSWGRLGKALDAYLGLVDLRQDPAGVADALARVGATMHAAGRLASATDYFDRADDVLTQDADADPSAHAEILVWCGRTRWEQGHHGAARRRWSRALALLVDVDEEAANRVRGLLATEPGYTSSSSSGGVG